MRKRKRRSARGAGIIYGAIAVSSILLASAIGTVVLVNIGFSTIYNEKLARVSSCAAQYAAAQGANATGASAVKDYTQQLMLAMGLTPKNVTIDVSQTTTNFGPSVEVTVANQFGLLGTQGVLPTQITLHDTAAATTGVND